LVRMFLTRLTASFSLKKRCLDILIFDVMMICMRTTLTIDDDLVRELREKAHQTGAPFKEIVNKAIRAGLEQIDKPKQIKPYKCKAYSLGYPPSADLNHALNLADRLESEEIARKLSLRK
jgi:hypothetical protein